MFCVSFDDSLLVLSCHLRNIVINCREAKANCTLLKICNCDLQLKLRACVRIDNNRETRRLYFLFCLLIRPKRVAMVLTRLLLLVPRALFLSCDSVGCRPIFTYTDDHYR